MVTCMYLESTFDLNFYPAKKPQKRTAVLHWYYNVVFPTVGSGGWIHGCAKIFWNQHDTTSTVYYSQVNIVGYSFPLLCVCVLILDSYHHSMLLQFLIHDDTSISPFLQAKIHSSV